MIMNPAYDPRQTAFGPFDKQVLALVIDKRLALPGEALPERVELLKLFEKAPPDIGSNKERAQLLSFLRSSPGGPAARRHRAVIGGGEEQLGMAIKVDPQDVGSWRTLGRLYRAQSARGRLEDLSRRYEWVFAVPLPQ